MTEILKQPQYAPLPEYSQVVIIFAATTGLLDDLAIEKIQIFEEKIIDFIKIKNKKLIEKLSQGNKLDDKTTQELKKAIEDFKKILR